MPTPSDPVRAEATSVDAPFSIRWESPLHRDHPLVGRIWSVDRAEWISVDALEADLAGARFVLLGEQHDNFDHHQLQARLVADLARGGRRPAVAFEMIDADRQGAIDALESPDPERFARAVDWGEAWGSFERYREIVAAALDADLPIVAANYPLARARALVREGLEAILPEDASRLGLDRPMAPEHRASLAEELREAHCGHQMPEPMIDGMILAQRARDASMANRMRETATGDGIILIAGAGHVRRDRGVPAVLVEQGVDPAGIRALAFAEVHDDALSVEGFASSADPAAIPYHYLWFTPAAEREDPCEAFRRHMRRGSEPSE